MVQYQIGSLHNDDGVLFITQKQTNRTEAIQVPIQMNQN